MRNSGLLKICITATVVVTAACASTSSTVASSRDVYFSDYESVEVEGRFYDAEDEIAECMAERGFDYDIQSPEDDFLVRIDFRTADPTFYITNLSEVDSFGYTLDEATVRSFLFVPDPAGDLTHENDQDHDDDADGEERKALYGSSSSIGCIEVAEAKVGSWDLENVVTGFREEFAVELASLETDPDFIFGDSSFARCTQDTEYPMISSLAPTGQLSSAFFQLLSGRRSEGLLETDEDIQSAVEATAEVDRSMYAVYVECLSPHQDMMAKAVKRSFSLDK